MKDIHKAALDKALSYLIAVGCQFAVIDPDGNKHGTLEVVAPKIPGKRNLKYPYGSIAAHLKPFLSQLTEIGKHTSFPVLDFDPQYLKTNAIAWCEYRFGKNKVLFEITDNQKSIEAIRLVP
jgi:hypothetical protein